MIPDVPELIESVPRYKNNAKLKAAGAKIPLTVEQARELKRIALDPIYFIENYIKIISIDDGYVPFKLYPYQKDLVKILHENRKTVALFPRQSGKCVSHREMITVRNKKTGEVMEIPIGEFFDAVESDRKNAMV
jgi:hypothetical protein